MTAELLTGALAAASLFLGAGLGLTLCLPGFATAGLAGRLGFAWLLGVAWIGLFLYAASHVAHLPLDGPLVFLAAFPPLAAGLAAAVRLLVLRRWRAPAPRAARRPLRTLGWVALSLFAVLVSSAVLAHALTHPLEDWDGRMTWTAQAMFVRDAGTVDAAVLRFPKSFVSHPRYPLLMPLAQIAALEAAGSDDERIVRVLYALFFPALVLLILEAGRRWAGSRAALLTALALLTIPWIPFDLEGGAIGAYSDLPLACFFGGGLLLLLRGRPRATDGVAAGLLLAAALLTKNEGLPEVLIALALAALSAGLALVRRRRAGRSRALATALAGVLCLAALWLLVSWRSAIPNRYDELYFETFSLASYARNLASPRPFTTIPVIALRMLNRRLWDLFWWLAPVLFVAAAPAFRRPPTAYLAAAAAVPLLVAWSAYAQVPAAAYYATVTWDRLLLQGCVPVLGLFAVGVRRLLHHFPRARRISASTSGFPSIRSRWG
ncbi:MAG TPA: hypothetical protein VGM86_14510 [Thermoanaerobaculia bacterium]